MCIHAGWSCSRSRGAQSWTDQYSHLLTDIPLVSPKSFPTPTPSLSQTIGPWTSLSKRLKNGTVFSPLLLAFLHTCIAYIAMHMPFDFSSRCQKCGFWFAMKICRQRRLQTQLGWVDQPTANEKSCNWIEFHTLKNPHPHHLFLHCFFSCIFVSVFIYAKGEGVGFCNNTSPWH